ncbi:Uncharacterised protein [Mycobacteroides abscessus]|nr:Uncharacterised protein [Mycobacteroides abscessus]
MSSSTLAVSTCWVTGGWSTIRVRPSAVRLVIFRTTCSDVRRRALRTVRSSSSRPPSSSRGSMTAVSTRNA